MSVSVDFTILGVNRFSAEILRANERAQDMRPVFGVIAYKWLNWNLLQFETEGARSGRPWPQLAESTVKKRKSAHPILKVRGDLEDEMTSRKNIDIRDRSMSFEVSDPGMEKIAGIHQSGNLPRMPRRRPIDFNKSDRREINKDLQAWVVAGRL